MDITLDNFFDYSNLKRVEQLLNTYYLLKEWAEESETIKCCVMDIEKALSSPLFTQIQLDCLKAIYMQSMTQSDYAKSINRSQYYVCKRLQEGLLLFYQLLNGDEED